MKHTGRRFCMALSSMGNGLRGWIVGEVVLLCLIFSGCSGNLLEFMADDDSKEAKLEDALMALNDEDFDKAASLLEKMDEKDPDIRRYLSNAYSGQAGLDTYSLIETIEKINDSGSEGSIDLVGTILDDDKNGTFSKNDIDEKAAKFDAAMETLLGIASEANGTARMVQALSVDRVDLKSKLDDPELEGDILVQLGLLGLNHAVLSIAKIILNDLEEAGVSEITLTEAWIKTQYADPNSFSIELTDEQTRLMDEITLDLTLLSASVSALLDIVGANDGNDLKESYESFLTEIDADKDLVLTASELEAYVKNL